MEISTIISTYLVVAFLENQRNFLPECQRSQITPTFKELDWIGSRQYDNSIIVGDMLPLLMLEVHSNSEYLLQIKTVRHCQAYIGLFESIWGQCFPFKCIHGKLKEKSHASFKWLLCLDHIKTGQDVVYQDHVYSKKTYSTQLQEENKTRLDPNKPT